MARTKSQFAESWEEASAPQDSQQAMQTHKVRKSRGVQTNRGLRRKTSSVHCAQRSLRPLVLEKLENVRKGKIRRYAEQSQWSFYQLLQFILYKAALRGVMVIEADPAYTSQECSRCHQLTKPNGKKFVCGKCGHNDHRDANAAFSLAERVMPIGGVVGDSVRSDSGLLIAPFLGTEVQQCN